MLAAQICREWHLGVLATRLPASRVPRCLFGAPNPRDTIELLQEALDAERARFARRWGVDPTAEDEDKENNAAPGAGKIAVVRLTPSKRRPAAACPYAKQTCIHDYWRSRKTSESGKKSSSSGALTEIKPNQQSPPAQPSFVDKVHSSPK